MKMSACERILGSDDYLITIVTSKRKWLFGRRYIRIKKYRGNWYRWYDAETKVRCGSVFELYLFALWIKERIG